MDSMNWEIQKSNWKLNKKVLYHLTDLVEEAHTMIMNLQERVNELEKEKLK